MKMSQALCVYWFWSCRVCYAEVSFSQLFQTGCCRSQWLGVNIFLTAVGLFASTEGCLGVLFIKSGSCQSLRLGTIPSSHCHVFPATPGINYRKKYVTSTAVLVALSLLCAHSFTLEICEMHIFGLPNPTMLRAFLAISLDSVKRENVI